jgi:hypothetical protein
VAADLKADEPTTVRNLTGVAPGPTAEERRERAAVDLNIHTPPRGLHRPARTAARSWVGSEPSTTTSRPRAIQGAAIDNGPLGA